VCVSVVCGSVLLSRYKTFNVRVNDAYVTRGNTAVVRCSVNPYYVRDYVTVKSWTQGSDTLTTGSHANDIRCRPTCLRTAVKTVLLALL